MCLDSISLSVAVLIYPSDGSDVAVYSNATTIFKHTCVNSGTYAVSTCNSNILSECCEIKSLVVNRGSGASDSNTGSEKDVIVVDTLGYVTAVVSCGGTYSEVTYRNVVCGINNVVTGVGLVHSVNLVLSEEVTSLGVNENVVDVNVELIVCSVGCNSYSGVLLLRKESNEPVGTVVTLLLHTADDDSACRSKRENNSEVSSAVCLGTVDHAEKRVCNNVYAVHLKIEAYVVVVCRVTRLVGVAVTNSVEHIDKVIVC